MNNKGFTLIELIIVMALFLFVIGAAIGIFIAVIQQQRAVLAKQEILNQVSYMEEYMSKAMRVATKDVSGNCLIDNSSLSPTNYSGYSYLLTRSVNGVYTGIKFLNQSDTDMSGLPACEEFYLDNGVLKEIKTYYPYAGSGDQNAVNISAQKFKINSIRFGIDGFSGDSTAGNPIGDQDSDNIPNINLFQPRVSIVMNAQIPSDNNNQTLTVQTTVSQRNLNAQ